ncbi:MAG: hypothetical protein ACRDUV_26720, partial [Pseudonocardiaceae bacterium]
MWLDFGDVPTWLATAGAGVAAYFVYRAYKIESGRDARAELGRRQTQGSRVAVWAELHDDPASGEPFDAECFAMRNASELPVYDVEVFSYRFGWRTVDEHTADAVFA